MKVCVCGGGGGEGERKGQADCLFFHQVQPTA